MPLNAYLNKLHEFLDIVVNIVLQHLQNFQHVHVYNYSSVFHQARETVEEIYQACHFIQVIT